MILAIKLNINGFLEHKYNNKSIAMHPLILEFLKEMFSLMAEYNSSKILTDHHFVKRLYTSITTNNKGE